MKKNIYFLALSSALFGAGVCSAGLLPPDAFSDSARGTTSASFLKAPASARLAALGFGGGALKAPDAFFCNPAGAAYIAPGSSALLLGYESLLGGSGRTAFAGLKTLERGVFGIGALYRYETGLTKYDDLGEAAGGFEAYDAAFSGYYGKRFGWGGAGLTLKYIRSKLYDRSAGTAAMDLGVLIKDKRNGAVEYALFARNLGLPMKLGSVSAPLPLELGGAWGFRYNRQFSLFMDARAPADHSPYLILSAEYGIPFADKTAESAAKPEAVAINSERFAEPISSGAVNTESFMASTSSRAVNAELFVEATSSGAVNSELFGVISATGAVHAELSEINSSSNAARAELSEAAHDGGIVRNGMFLRSGFNFKNYEDLGLMGAFSAGFGIKLGEIALDYAFVPYGDLGTTHRFAISWSFGSVPAKL